MSRHHHDLKECGPSFQTKALVVAAFSVDNFRIIIIDFGVESCGFQG